MHKLTFRTIGTAFGLFAVALFVLAGSAPVTAQVSTPTAGDDAVYHDPAGRFSVPIPTNWVAEEHDGYVSLVTNDRKIMISLVVVQGTSATAAIGTALQQLGSDATPASPVVATPLAEGDAVAGFASVDTPEPGQMEQAFAQRVGDVVFVLVLQGDQDAIAQRQVQVDKIFFGVQVDMSAVGSPTPSPAP